jgi:hypothetical protein
MDRQTFEFVTYIINYLAWTLNRSAPDVYAILSRTGCIKEYLAPCYDVLHTLSTENVASDVMKFVSSRGESL